MFVDQARIFVKAGNGGNGAVSFYRGKYIPKGGPDGGNGGRGGSVYIKAKSGMTTLQNFRDKKKYLAENGEHGGKQKKAGKSGEDLTIEVPIGTVVRNYETGELLADLTEAGETVLLSKGGRGGVGNTAFATSTRQTPTFAKPGELVDGFYVSLELKILADVGLLGLPNVGKSTYLSVISRSQPKIANYHFTTLEPQLGIATVGDFSFTVADIPGLIEGASEGAGLGHDFLRHIERTKMLVHVLDASGSEGRDPYEDFQMINRELREFSEILADKPQIVALNKIDLCEEEDVLALKKKIEADGYEVHSMSAPINWGTDDLLKAIAGMLVKLPETILYEKPEQVKVYELEELTYEVYKEDDIYVVEGTWIDDLLRRVNFDSVDSLQWFQKQLRDQGIVDQLHELGAEEGDTIALGDLLFDFVD